AGEAVIEILHLIPERLHRVDNNDQHDDAGNDRNESIGVPAQCVSAIATGAKSTARVEPPAATAKTTAPAESTASFVVDRDAVGEEGVRIVGLQVVNSDGAGDALHLGDALRNEGGAGVDVDGVTEHKRVERPMATRADRE